MLLGDRKEFRIGEIIGKGLMRALSFVFIGNLKKYKAIRAEDVAKAMIAVANKDFGSRVLGIESGEIMRIAKMFNTF